MTIPGKIPSFLRKYLTPLGNKLGLKKDIDMQENSIDNQFSAKTIYDRDAFLALDLIGFNTDTSVQTDSHGIRVLSNGNYALVPDRGGDQILVWDVSDPSNPTVDNTLTSTEIAETHYITIGPNEDYAYTFGNGYFIVIGISDPTAITQAGYIQLNTTSENSQEVVIGPNNNYAFAADVYTDTLYSVDISTKTSPSQADSISGAGSPNYLNKVAHLELNDVGDVLFATSYEDHHLGAFDVSTPTSISLISTITTDIQDPHELIFYNDYLYIACVSATSQAALLVYDVSNTSSLTHLKSITEGTDYPASEYPLQDLHGLQIDKEHNRLFTSSEGLSVWDISTPDSPLWLGSNTTFPGQQVDFLDGHLYLAKGTGWTHGPVVWIAEYNKRRLIKPNENLGKVTFRAIKTTDQTGIASGTNTKVEWDSVIDPFNMYDSTDWTIRIPFTGKYAITLKVVWSPIGSDTWIQTMIRDGANNTLLQTSTDVIGALIHENSAIAKTDNMEFSVGTTLKAMGRQESGTTQDIFGLEKLTYWEITKIG